MIKKNLIGVLLLTTSISTACQANQPPENAKSALSNAVSSSNEHFKGELLSTMNAGGYTYVNIKIDDQSIWAAGPATPVNKGDLIEFNSQMPMLNFFSKSLNRNFDTIYFVDHFSVNGSNTQAAHQNSPLEPHKNIKSGKNTVQIKSFSSMKNGQSISEVLENKNNLANKTVKIRAQVTKFTKNIMGKNWIHIRDSSTQKDITITTDAITKLDDIILVEGKLSLNKDYGYGYIYDVIIEDASIKIENL